MPSRARSVGSHAATRNVSFDEKRLPAGIENAGCDSLASLRHEFRNRNTGALVREQLRAGTTDTGPCARDERDLALQSANRDSRLPV